MSDFSGKDITRAGETLIIDGIAEKDRAAFDQAMDVLSYWRACHEEPLRRALAFLTEAAQKVDNKAVAAKRLKRTPSIVRKLQRFKGMSLRSMQDIGGCRAILSNEKRVRKLVRELKKRMDFRIRDYITNPKKDGYRSIHLVGDFSQKDGVRRIIELQIRTAAQHSWATAVEIIDLFTGQAIKTNQGDEDWKRFFLAAGTLFALIEDIPLYNQIDGNKLKNEIYLRLINPKYPKQHAFQQNCEQLFILADRLDIIEHFNAYAGSLKAVDERLKRETKSGYILLIINIKKHEVKGDFYIEERFNEAAEAYLQAEKRAAVLEGVVVALVSTDAVGGIKEAYPNYFADSSTFTNYISTSVNAYKQFNPSGISRLIKKVFS